MSDPEREAVELAEWSNDAMTAMAATLAGAALLGLIVLIFW